MSKLNREQMIAWLTIEGWKMVWCNSDTPALLHNDALVYKRSYDKVTRTPLPWRVVANGRAGTECPADQYSTRWLEVAIKEITKHENRD